MRKHNTTSTQSAITSFRFEKAEFIRFWPRKTDHYTRTARQHMLHQFILGQTLIFCLSKIIIKFFFSNSRDSWKILVIKFTQRRNGDRISKKMFSLNWIKRTKNLFIYLLSLCEKSYYYKIILFLDSPFTFVSLFQYLFEFWSRISCHLIFRFLYLLNFHISNS